MTSNKSKNFLNHPFNIAVGSTVVGGIILSVVLYLWTNVFSWLGSFSQNLYNLLINFLNLSTPVYVLILAFVLYYMTKRIIKHLMKETPIEKKPNWLDFKQNIYDGILYKWNYEINGNTYEIINLSLFCQNCECRLVDTSGLCPNCGKFSNFPYDLYNNSILIKARIEHRISQLQKKIS